MKSLHSMTPAKTMDPERNKGKGVAAQELGGGGAEMFQRGQQSRHRLQGQETVPDQAIRTQPLPFPGQDCLSFFPPPPRPQSALRRPRQLGPAAGNEAERPARPPEGTLRTFT